MGLSHIEKQCSDFGFQYIYPAVFQCLKIQHLSHPSTLINVPPAMQNFFSESLKLPHPSFVFAPMPSFAVLSITSHRKPRSSPACFHKVSKSNKTASYGIYTTWSFPIAPAGTTS